MKNPFKKTPDQRREVAEAHESAADVHKAKKETSIAPGKRIGHFVEQKKHEVAASRQRKKAGPEADPEAELREIAEEVAPETEEASTE